MEAIVDADGAEVQVKWKWSSVLTWEPKPRMQKDAPIASYPNKNLQVAAWPTVQVHSAFQNARLPACGLAMPVCLLSRDPLSLCECHPTYQAPLSCAQRIACHSHHHAPQHQNYASTELGSVDVGLYCTYFCGMRKNS